MKWRYIKLFFVFCLMSVLIFQLAQCQSDATHKAAQTSEKTYLNLNDSVQYVGMNTCKSCHLEIYNTFIKTGMGRSFHAATPQKSAALFDAAHALVYDTALNFYYYPYFSNDSLFISEFRLNHKDTVFKRTEYIAYIIGSGNHTNSHLVNFNGYIYQAPITFYTQKQQWDLAPGFEKGFNSRYERIINNECMTCHNALPEWVKGSENRFASVPSGIDCERCHGPGGIHVAEKLKGNIVATEQEIDYTIVNPKKLNKELQMSLCQRCHLQGLSILKEGKSYEDFKPGMHLNEVMEVFLPVFNKTEGNFLMASHAERLVRSKCFQQSDLTCITCHNPHISVLETTQNTFNEKCLQCHSAQNAATQLTCTISTASDNNNCVNCHMPNTGSVDIPHVSIHDHFISKPKQNNQQHLDSTTILSIQQLIELKSYTSAYPDDLMKAKAFLGFYEKFSKNNIYLDSAKIYLDKIKHDTLKTESLIHFYYLKENFIALTQLAKQHPSKIKEAWTFYRVGEAFYAQNNFVDALFYFENAVQQSPYQLDFLNKQASALFQLGNLKKAKAVYESIINLQPYHKEALNNLGYLYVLENNLAQADDYISQSLRLDPDYEKAVLNKAGLLLQNKNRVSAKKLILAYLKNHPESEKSKKILEIIEGYDKKN